MRNVYMNLSDGTIGFHIFKRAAHDAVFAQLHAEACRPHAVFQIEIRACFRWRKRHLASGIGHIIHLHRVERNVLRRAGGQAQEACQTIKHLFHKHKNLVCCHLYKRDCKSFLAHTFLFYHRHERIDRPDAFKAEGVVVLTPAFDPVGKGLDLGEEALGDKLVVAQCRNKSVSPI